MELSVREAATLIGTSPRTLRARLVRGDLPGKKRGGRWRIDRRDLPLTEKQRRALQARADAIRRAVDDALPSRAAATAGQRARSLADLEAFRRLAELVREIEDADPGSHRLPGRRSVTRRLRTALLALADAVHQYEPAVKLAAVRRARSMLAQGVALLLLESGGAPAPEPVFGWVHRLENEVLPAVAGFARWVEGLRSRER